MLVLFLMIVLPVISQKKYIIDGDTLIGYTQSENRSIAVIMVEGDKCKDVSKQNDVIIDSLSSMNYNYIGKIQLINEKTTLQQAQIFTINSNIDKCIADKKTLDNQRRWWKTGTITGFILALGILLFK